MNNQLPYPAQSSRLVVALTADGREISVPTGLNGDQRWADHALIGPCVTNDTLPSQVRL